MTKNDRFDIEDRNKRKYQCFCCGVQFLDPVEFKAHIIEKHEEGRDYVICPLSHCQTPIRDLRTHWAVCHRGQPMPKQTAMRSIVWKDFTTQGKKKKKAVSKIREGYHVSTKMGRNLHYRSGWECTVYECLDTLTEVEAYYIEPFEIPYTISSGPQAGEPHHYKPDILIHFADGHKELWEVKPMSQTHLAVNQDKWAAANEACRIRGWDFVVMTEKGINKLKAKVRKRGL